MTAELKTRHPWWCGCKPPQPVDSRLRGVWRFEGRDGALLRFRLWQVTAESTGHAVPTTETYTIGSRAFWASTVRAELVGQARDLLVEWYSPRAAKPNLAARTVETLKRIADELAAVTP